MGSGGPQFDPLWNASSKGVILRASSSQQPYSLPCEGDEKEGGREEAGRGVGRSVESPALPCPSQLCGPVNPCSLGSLDSGLYLDSCIWSRPDYQPCNVPQSPVLLLQEVQDE